MPTVLTATPVIAHQSGWDEVLLLAVPVVIVAVAIGWYERRSKRDDDH